MTKSEVQQMITDTVKTNNSKSITGAALQSVLLAMTEIDSTSNIIMTQQEFTALGSINEHGSNLYSFVCGLQNKPTVILTATMQLDNNVKTNVLINVLSNMLCVVFYTKSFTYESNSISGTMYMLGINLT